MAPALRALLQDRAQISNVATMPVPSPRAGDMRGGRGVRGECGMDMIERKKEEGGEKRETMIEFHRKIHGN